MKIAIVGAGIVGSTAAYYLSKEKDVEVTVFRSWSWTSNQGSSRDYQPLVF